MSSLIDFSIDRYTYTVDGGWGGPRTTTVRLRCVRETRHALPTCKWVRYRYRYSWSRDIRTYPAKSTWNKNRRALHVDTYIAAVDASRSSEPSSINWTDDNICAPRDFTSKLFWFFCAITGILCLKRGKLNTVLSRNRRGISKHHTASHPSNSLAAWHIQVAKGTFRRLSPVVY